MELRQLKYFLVLSQELHFSEAAFKLGISQPTLSQQIKVLEGEVGSPLVDRLGKKNSLTAAGVILEKYAKAAISQLESAQLAIDDLNNQHNSLIRVAMLPSDLDYRLGSVLSEFHRDFPKVKIQVIPSIEIKQKLLANEVDIGVGLVGETSNRLVERHIYTETYDLYLNDRHPLAQQASVTPQEIANLPLVMYPEGFYGRRLLADWANDQEIQLTPIMETGSAASQFQLAEKEVGMTIQPQQLIEELGDKQLVAIEITQAPTREVAIMYLKDKYLSHAMLELIERLSYLF